MANNMSPLFLLTLCLTGVLSMTVPVENIMQENDDVLAVTKSNVRERTQVAPYVFTNCTTLAADLEWWTNRVCPTVRGRPDRNCVQGKETYIPYYEELTVEMCSSASASPSSLPDASYNDYDCKCIEFEGRKPNVVVFENLVAQSDSQGAMMVGGDAHIRAGFSIGMETGTPFTDMLFVGGDLDFPSGSVVGDIHYGGEATLGASIRNSRSRVHNDLPVDFGAVRAHFEQLSASLCAMAPTGGIQRQGGVLRILRNNMAVEVFRMNATSLDISKSVDLSGVSGSASLIMNVFGNSVDFHHYQSVVDDRHVVWNFCDATEITISKSEVSGSVLAPFAHVTGQGGVIQGQFVANSYTGTTQFNDNACRACIDV